jgi:hypothetical protein
MKIGILSDTHFPAQARQCRFPQKLLDAFQGVRMILHAGDIGDPACLDVLKKICPDIRAVSGNMDTLQTKKDLPERLLISVGAHTIGLTHGFGAPAHLIEYVRDVFKDDRVDVIVFGHSHTPVNEMRDGILYFNPGSPTDTMFASYNSCGILEIGAKVEGQIIRL